MNNGSRVSLCVRLSQVRDIASRPLSPCPAEGAQQGQGQGSGYGQGTGFKELGTHSLTIAAVKKSSKGRLHHVRLKRAKPVWGFGG